MAGLLKSIALPCFNVIHQHKNKGGWGEGGGVGIRPGPLIILALVLD